MWKLQHRHHCTSAGDEKRVQQWFRWMQEAVQLDVTSYSSIMNACAQVDDETRAEQWCKWMQEADVQPDVRATAASSMLADRC